MRKTTGTVEGLSVLDLGVAKVTARGEVKGLKKIEDFNGNYALVAAGGAAGGGAGSALLKNQNGVEMALRRALDRPGWRRRYAQEVEGRPTDERVRARHARRARRRKRSL
jgi:hypothetical protein